MFNLWYLSNISCGAATDNFFRSDLIDRIDPASNCPEFYYIKFSRTDSTYSIALKYSADHPSIEDVFLSDSVYEIPSATPAPHTSYVNTNDGYQYRQTDAATGRYMYVGIRYGPTDPHVQFIVDLSGHDLQGDLPVSSDVVKIELLAVYPAGCTDTTTQSPPDIQYCDTPPSIVVESDVYNVVYGDNVTLRCTINSTLPVNNVTWVTVLDGNIHMNITSLPEDVFYSIESVTFNHSGYHKCEAYNELRITNFGLTFLNVTGGIPRVITTSSSSIYKNTTDSVILDCTIFSSPSATSVYWMRSDAGSNITVSISDPRFSIDLLPKASLTITDLQESDTGEYFCVGTNVLGDGVSTGITLTVTNVNQNAVTSTYSITTVSDSTTTTADPNYSTSTADNNIITTNDPNYSTTTADNNIITTNDPNYSTTTADNNIITTDDPNYSTTTTPNPNNSNNTTSGLCPCSCEYKAKVDYWAAHNVSNMTYDEIVIWLQPKLIQLEKILKIDKKNLSAIINKHISAADSRPSARNIGVIGVAVMVTVMALIILVDVSSFTRHAATIKMLCCSTTEDESGK